MYAPSRTTAYINTIFFNLFQLPLNMEYKELIQLHTRRVSELEAKLLESPIYQELKGLKEVIKSLEAIQAIQPQSTSVSIDVHNDESISDDLSIAEAIAVIFQKTQVAMSSGGLGRLLAEKGYKSDLKKGNLQRYVANEFSTRSKPTKTKPARYGRKTINGLIYCYPKNWENSDGSLPEQHEPKRKQS